jgi:Ca-activated chloride channel family protein
MTSSAGSTRCAFAALCVCAAAVAIAAAPPERQQFRSGTDLVRLSVVVTGRDGLLVRGLAPGAFEVFEDGVKQTVSAFAEGGQEEMPLHAGLLVDRSGSMELDLREAANAAIQFINALDEARDVTFVDFNSSIRIGRFEPQSYPHLFERIREQSAEGMTALWDAVAAYLRNVSERAGQHVLVLYTDGGDSTSRLRFNQLLTMLRSGNVMVYAIGYLENQLSASRTTGQMYLTSLAREAGGEAFFPSSPKELHKIYARILDEIGSRYTIGYVSTNTKPDGKFRKVQIKLTSPEHKSAKVRTRTGYLAPGPAGR